MSNSDSKRTLKLVGSLVLIAVAGALIVPRLLPRSDATRMGLMGAMSQELAREIDVLNQGPARIVSVSLANARSSFASAKALGIFKAAAQSQGHSVVAEEYIPLEEMLTTDEGVQIKASTLLDLMGRHSDATVFVSFMGIPNLETDGAEQLAAQSAQFVAVSFGEPTLDKLLSDGVVDLAVVFSEATPTDDPELTSPEDLKQYITIRRAGE